MDIYNYISAIDTTDRAIYVTIIVAVTLLSSRVSLSSHAIGIVTGAIVVIYLHSSQSQYINSMKNIMTSMPMGSGAGYLSKNSELLIFLDEHREFSEYNPELWKTLVKSVDRFIHLVQDIESGSQHYNLDYSVLRGVAGHTISAYHAFIYTTPNIASANNKFHLGMIRLQRLLDGEIDIVHRTVALRNRGEINTSTVFHYKNHPAAYHRQEPHLDRYAYP
jgi:hypothetical protein